MNLVREKRIEKGLSQHQLGKMCGISRSSINNIEGNPKYNPSVENAKKLGEILGFDWGLIYEKEYRINDQTINSNGSIETTKNK